jgi:methylase of polypeptide subunit release factors
MQDKIYKTVLELRNAVIGDLKRSGHHFGVMQDEFSDDLAYYLLLRIFIVKFIIKNKIKVSDLIAAEDINSDIVTIEKTFEILSEQIDLFSKEHFEYILPSDETYALIEEKLSLLEPEISEDDFISSFYEAYNYCRTQSKEESLKQINENTAITTQIYTPFWLCKLLVKNALANLSVSIKPEEIKIFDPSCGCGNFLLAAFDGLAAIYESNGYERNEIPGLIIKNNIHGFDIEDKAVQIAKVSLFLKSRSFSAKTECSHFNLFSSEFILDINAAKEFLLSSEKKDNMETCLNKLNEFSNISVLGSLIKVENDELEILQKISGFASDRKNGICKGENVNFTGILDILSKKYDILLSNPPFVLPYLYNDILNDFIKHNFVEGVDFSNNLYSCFIKRAVDLLKENGQLVMLHPASLFYDRKFGEVKNFLKRNFMFSYIISMNSMAVFDNYVKKFDVVIYLLKKDKPAKKVYFRRLADNSPMTIKTEISEIFNKDNIKCSDSGRTNLKRAMFFLNHPNFYDRFLYRFFSN